MHVKMSTNLLTHLLKLSFRNPEEAPGEAYRVLLGLCVAAVQLAGVLFSSGLVPVQGEGCRVLLGLMDCMDWSHASSRTRNILFAGRKKMGLEPQPGCSIIAVFKTTSSHS